MSMTATTYDTGAAVRDTEATARTALALAWSVCGQNQSVTADCLRTATRAVSAASATSTNDDGVMDLRAAVGHAWSASSNLVAAMAATRNDRYVRALADAYVAVVAYRRALEVAHA